MRITHKPTGIVVAMQDEKSQLQNRAKALQVLRSRLLKAQQDRQAAEQSAERAPDRERGRSEKIRTHNFKENRVTDHRIKLTSTVRRRSSPGISMSSPTLMQDERVRQLQDAATS